MRPRVHRSRVPRRLRAAAALGAVIAACGPVRPAKEPGEDLRPKSILLPPGVALVEACTPTGPEICFNGVDDNCNGVLEEGCGLGTGLLQFVIAWGDNPADVDLSVTDPAGIQVFEGNRQSASGLRFERDCPAPECYEQNVENVFFEGLEPPHGAYVVNVKLSKLNGATAPVTVRLGARVGQRSYGADVALSQAEEQKSFTFKL